MNKLQSTTSTRFIIAADTHAGARGKNNEDSYDVFEVPLQNTNGTAQQMTIAVVADGVTSRSGGAQASQLAVKTIRSILEKGLPDGSRTKQLEEVILRANREIYNFAQANAVMESMSTTMVLAAVENQQLYVLHVGDSRAYLIRGRAVYLLTLDHTWVQRAMDEGRINAAEAKVHPNRHVIVRYLGIEQRISVDPRIIVPESTLANGQRAYEESLALYPGDAILLCTDGLTDQVKDQELAEAVRTHWLKPKAAIKQLIDLALKRQEPDNITVALIELPDGALPLTGPLRKINPLYLGLAALVLIGVLIWGGNLWSNQGQPTTPPQVVTTVNPPAQALAVAATVTPLPPTNTPATGNSATPAIVTPTATLPPPTLIAAPIAPTATLQNGAAQPNAPATAQEATAPLDATATLAPSPTPSPSATPTLTPTPAIQLSLTNPPNGATVTGPTTFQWTITNLNNRATLYALSLWPDGQPATKVVIKNDPIANQATVDLNSAPGGLTLQSGASYNWQIQLRNPTGAVADSAVGTFTYQAPPTATPTATPQPRPSGGNSNNDDDDDDEPQPTATPNDSPGTGN